ncbi:MAG: hypothetical protein RLO51_11025 [Thalassobaculum sp.]|uniref:hypothetical protein n=1 Tax=Thalassobaculum sp. TaxID=2022740 RepID=UPI0032EF7D64
MYLYLKRWKNTETTGFIFKSSQEKHHLRVRLELSAEERQALARTKAHTTHACVLNSEDAIWTIQLFDEPYIDLEHVNEFKIVKFVDQFRETALALQQLIEQVTGAPAEYEEIVEG